jgi:predicted ATP-binding protein involved in virulence
MSNFITEIKIGKVRHLKNIDIVLGDEKKHLILTGKNGSGKTSVLEELQKNLLNRGSTIEVFFYGKNLSEIFSLYNLGINNNYPDYIYTYFKAKRELKTYQPKSPKKIELSKDKIEKLNKDFLQYILNLKIEYLFAQLDNDIEVSKELNNWFNRFESMLKQIFNDESFKIIFDRKNYNFWMERDNRERFDLNSLSDGYSAIMDIVTELILKIENTKSKSFDCEGIVLIDEIETHLHVELQKNILPLLTNFFPNIQFIVTTHSPFVLQSIENSVVYDLERKEQLSGKRLHIASYTDIVKNYFEVDSEFSKVLENKIVRYEKLVDQFENNTLDIEREKELLNLDIKLDEIAPMMSKNIFLRFKESQDRINDYGES